MSLQKPCRPAQSDLVRFIHKGGHVGPLRLFGRTVMTKPMPTDRVAAEQSDVVLFGLDETGKPRAARFGREHADLAAKAAGLMNLAIRYVNSAELAASAQQLPAGRIHANGRGLVPNVRRDLYDRLIAASEAVAKTDRDNQGAGKSADNPTETSVPNSAPPSPAPGVTTGYPREWDDISVGHLVIAQEDADSGWWEAIVIAREGDMVTMRWRDYPGHPKFVQHRTAVALLKPGTP
jgi:hypothetical protein